MYMVRQFKSDAQRKACFSNMSKNKVVTFKVPKKIIPEYTEQINVDRLTFAKMKAMSDKSNINWFDKSAMEFFNTKIEGAIYISPTKKVYFLTSETFEERDPMYPRKYTIRQFLPHTGGVEDVGEFRGYDTFNDASKVMLKLK